MLHLRNRAACGRDDARVLGIHEDPELVDALRMPRDAAIPEVKTEEVDVAAAKVSELVLLPALTAAVGARGMGHVASDPATHRLPRDAQLPRAVRRVRAGPRQLKGP